MKQSISEQQPLTSKLKQLLDNSPLSSSLLKFEKLALELPKLALKPMQVLPNGVQSTLIETALNNLLEVQREDGELSFLIDRWLAVRITDADYSFFVSVIEHDASSILEQTIVVKTRYHFEPDVVFSGDTKSLLQIMGRNLDPDTLFFQRKLLVTGNTELGLQIKNFLDDLDLENMPSLLMLGLTIFNEVVQRQQSLDR